MKEAQIIAYLDYISKMLASVVSSFRTCKSCSLVLKLVNFEVLLRYFPWVAFASEREYIYEDGLSSLQSGAILVTAAFFQVVAVRKGVAQSGT